MQSLMLSHIHGPLVKIPFLFNSFTSFDILQHYYFKSGLDKNSRWSLGKLFSKDYVKISSMYCYHLSEFYLKAGIKINEMDQKWSTSKNINDG